MSRGEAGGSAPLTTDGGVKELRLKFDRFMTDVEVMFRFVDGAPSAFVGSSETEAYDTWWLGFAVGESGEYNCDMLDDVLSSFRLAFEEMRRDGAHVIVWRVRPYLSTDGGGVVPSTTMSVRMRLAALDYSGRRIRPKNTHWGVCDLHDPSLVARQEVSFDEEEKKMYAEARRAAKALRDNVIGQVDRKLCLDPAGRM
jgi:hypothetical protein